MFSVDIILAIAINGNGDIAMVLCFHQTGKHGVLMAAVAALGDADVMFILLCQVTDDFPGFIPGTIVDKEDTAAVADFSF